MRRFKSGEVDVLVSTDATAKGIDVPGVTVVVQMELCRPQMRGRPGGVYYIRTAKRGLEQYQHRAGRTARSLQKGLTVTLLLPDEEADARGYMTTLRVPNERVRF
eukprot:CAMPEP_0172158924 /NCGR_PEP_ID=MMETSP1050-20130122/4661_1 /TAXON_ID=233186 /ORGANISM="Cryptomonas curvata, Strain CCAP979/52" /LENGTH=104 /DNA_ID=CAMNT_0012828407 /DNA_START=9 /DNA_END=320 /DNA_ORIENTATION=-